jgi:hypothetical protein
MLLLFQRPVCAPLVRLRSTVSTLCLEGPSVYVFLCLYRLFEEEITGRRSTYSTYHNPLWHRSMQDAGMCSSRSSDLFSGPCARRTQKCFFVVLLLTWNRVVLNYQVSSHVSGK